MTDTTKMPDNIWAYTVYQYPQGDGFGHWYNEDVSGAEKVQGYIRHDLHEDEIAARDKKIAQLDWQAYDLDDTGKQVLWRDKFSDMQDEYNAEYNENEQLRQRLQVAEAIIRNAIPYFEQAQSTASYEVKPLKLARDFINPPEKDE